MEDAIKELTRAIEKLVPQSNSLDYIAILFSFIAILISIYGIVIQKKINSANLQSVYFKEIFGEYLKTKVVDSTNKLTFDQNGKLDKSYRKISKVMFSMVREAGYFKYVDNDFYQDLSDMVKALDEYLVSLAAEVVTDREEQGKELILVHKKITDIIQLINKAYQKF